MERKALYEIIADKLEFTIVSDLSGDKQKLPSEQRLATAFGVSRPVIREAIKILKARGLIESRQGAPTFIKAYGVEDFQKSLERIAHAQNVTMEQIFEVRVALELASIQLAARNVTEEDLTNLREINAQMRSPNAGKHELADADTLFHVTLAKCSKNPLLVVMTEAFSGQLKKWIQTTVNENTKVDGVAFHEKLIEAIERGDEDKARNLMQAHLVLSMRNFEKNNEEK